MLCQHPGFCCLQVHMVYNGSNLWANFQHTCQPWRMSWHLADDRLWTPFFGRSFPAMPLSTLQLPVKSGLPQPMQRVATNANGLL